jgi:hypothetical protein
MTLPTQLVPGELIADPARRILRLRLRIGIESRKRGAFHDRSYTRHTQSSGSPNTNPKKRGLLTKIIVPVLCAVIPAAATYFAARTTAPSTASAKPAQPAPSISITGPADGAHVPMDVTAQGTVENLRPNQVVMVYIEPFTDDASNAPSGNFYSALGPCPVTSNGSWSCTLEVGGPHSFGDQSYIWAAIVSSAQAYAGDQQTSENLKPFGYAGDPAPPSIGGATTGKGRAGQPARYPCRGSSPLTPAMRCCSPPRTGPATRPVLSFPSMREPSSGSGAAPGPARERPASGHHFQGLHLPCSGGPWGSGLTSA